MRRPQEVYVKPGGVKSRSTTLPAPIGGLNARDSVANMPAQDAVMLDNWFPRSTDVVTRGGYDSWNTFTGLCQTILVYTGPTSTKIFPCIKNGSTYSIMDGTSSGAVSTAVVGGSGPTVQALTSTRFDYAVFTTTGGTFLTAVNGADTPLEYNGSAWSSSGTTGGTPANYFTVGVYAKRLFYGVKDSFDVYYLAADTKSGAATRLHLGALFKKGGSLNSIITVTDSSNSLTDYIGFLSTEGEIAVYTGTDPATAADWQLAAFFEIGYPVIKGNRCWEKRGSDAVVLCADGVYPLRKAIAAQNRSEGLSVSDKIRTLINSDIVTHGSRYGWEVMAFPKGTKLIVNVPTSEDRASYQYVMNTETGAWCRFTGWNAFCFAVARDTLYWGGNGIVVKADTGYDDNGEPIFSDARQAYNYLGNRGRKKHIKLMQPVLAIDADYGIGVSADADFADRTNLTLRTMMGGSGDPWGGVWDVTWAGGTVVQSRWYSVPQIGTAIAPRVRARTEAGSVSWSATNVLYEVGAVVG